MDTDEILAFVNDINDVWQHSRLIFTTDTQIVVDGLYGRSDGARYLPADMIYMIVPDTANAESFYYVEQLQRFDKEFGFDTEDPSLTVETRLERINEILLAKYTNDSSRVNGLLVPCRAVRKASVSPLFV